MVSNLRLNAHTVLNDILPVPFINIVMFYLHSGSESTRKHSLSPPIEPQISWQTYINSPPGEPPCLGREHICKESRKTFKATVAMSEDFPLTVEMLLSVLEVRYLAQHSMLPGDNRRKG